MEWTEQEIQRITETARRRTLKGNPESISNQDRNHQTETELAFERLVTLTDSVPPRTDCDVTFTPHESRPFLAVNKMTEGLTAADTTRLRGLWPVVNLPHHDACTDLISQNVQTEFIIDASVLSALKEAQTATGNDDRTNDRKQEWLTTLATSDNCTVYRASSRLNFDLFITDEAVFIGLYVPGYFDPDVDSSGILDIYVGSADPVFLDWAHGIFERYCESAERIELSV
ncbi:hypothetical protein SAMN04487948_14512 [Halogranum amylolyticum]|uniref:Methanogenesis regulatory protein FilR1 middle domain-containing protein n=1 Tax=Halogranum amylolyticum TaxID=660520 RepID=A0A1H8WUU9_9EURY|nr:hypothetical protein [Halogranum amylolyticum]SEP31470.1 hypothetical protein SAMN04487948_14512 [Halogranum amylolyticum]